MCIRDRRNTAASSAVVALGQTATVAPLSKKIPRRAVARVLAVDPLATEPPSNATQEGSARGKVPAWHTLLHDEMELADLATPPRVRCRSEPATWKTQLPSFWELPRGDLAEGDMEHIECVRPVCRTREISSETERPDMSVYAGTPRAGKITAGNTAEAAAQARPPRWCSTWKGCRSECIETRMLYFFEECAEV